MKLCKAIAMRMIDVCNEKGISVCEAALKGGKSPSVIYDLLKGRTSRPQVSTLQSFCEGAGLTLSQFFDADCFRGIEDDNSAP